MWNDFPLTDFSFRVQLRSGEEKKKNKKSCFYISHKTMNKTIFAIVRLR